MHGQTQIVGVIVAGDYVAAELRIEHAEFLDGYVEHVADLLECYAVGHAHAVGEQWLLGKARTDVVILKIGHHIVGCNECRHIAASFARQIFIYFPEVAHLAFGGSCTAQRLIHLAGTAVIGGYGKRPVVVDVIKILEIFGGFLARAIWVATLIYERIDFEAQALGGAHHKLPQTGSTHARHGVGIDGRFYHGQIFQFERQTLALECILKDGHIIETHAEHLLHEGATAIDVHLYIVLHHRVKRHLYGGGHGLKSCDIHIIAHLHVLGVVDIGVEHGVVLQIPIIHHCLGIGLETLGIDYRFVANRSLDGVNIAFFLGSGGDCSHGYRRHCQYS